jgi:hypothetical protein
MATSVDERSSIDSVISDDQNSDKVITSIAVLFHNLLSRLKYGRDSVRQKPNSIVRVTGLSGSIVKPLLFVAFSSYNRVRRLESGNRPFL